MLRRCRSQVSAMVSKRDVASSPWALRLPKQILRHCTPVRRARSTLLLQEDEEPVVMLEKSRGQIANLAVRALQVLLRQRVNPFSNGDRSLQQLAAIDLAAAEFVPQSEESGVLGQGIAAESLHCATLGQ